MQLPETIRVEKVGGASIIGITSLPIQWGMGKKEVAILLGVRFVIDELGGAINDAYLRWALDRKSEGAPGSLLLEDTQDLTHIICGGGAVGVVVVEGATFGFMTEDFIFPYPVVLIRPSQIHLESAYNGIKCGAYLYYVTQTVSDEQLAKLMVKDHA